MPAAPSLRRAARAEWRALTACLALLGAALGALNGLGRPDATLYDAALVWSPRPAPADIVIIAIDEPSLAALGRWPWPRAVHARLLARLDEARPRALGLDLVLAEPENGDSDGALARAIRRLPTVLPVFMEQRANEGRREARVVLPVPVLAGAAALGHIHVEVDADGIARSVFLEEGWRDESGRTQRWPHFARAMLAAANPASNATPPPGERNPHPPRAGSWTRDFWLHLPFVGPPGTIQRLSYVDVLEGRADPAGYAGKFVLIGATAAGLGDAYSTPVSGHARLMPGVEISANVLAALNEGHGIVRATPWANALYNLAPLLIAMAGLRRFGPRRGLMLTAALIIALPLCSWWLLARGVWFAPSAGLLALALAYPLWSWRRLEAGVRYLGDEFARLAAEPRVLPEAAPTADSGGDLLERRISALAGAADRLRNLRRFVSGTLDSLPDAALVTDRDGRVLIANRAACAPLAAASAEDLRGGSIGELLARLATTDGATPTWEALRALSETPGPDRPQRSLECVTDYGRHVLARCAPLEGGDGHPAGWIVTLADISELREAERQREEVLAFLSHDMRSPQTSIMALLELHALDPDDNPKEQVHARIEQYARRTLSLSDQFLQLARAETKAYEPTVEDLTVLAEEAVDDTWAAAEQKSIRLRVQADGEPLPVRADRPLLLRAIVNLLTNAVKYSAEGTVVTVTVAARDGKHICEVADQGYGISPEDQARLFERFRRFSAPGQPKAQGAGLGMAFVKTVIEKHQGRISVQSVPGTGSVFTLHLPPVGESPVE